MQTRCKKQEAWKRGAAQSVLLTSETLVHERKLLRRGRDIGLRVVNVYSPIQHSSHSIAPFGYLRFRRVRGRQYPSVKKKSRRADQPCESDSHPSAVHRGPPRMDTLSFGY